jgi:HAD superfamily hydrolase (TIGR01459 family)
MKLLTGLRELVARYDLFIVDQYGVLHNGTVAHAGAVDCFQRLLREHPDKRVVILSNTSRRASGVTRLLASLGFDTGFAGSITGGEAAWRYLRDHRDTLSKCALMTSNVAANVGDRDTNAESMFYGLDHLRVTPLDEADFLLVEGSLQISYSGDERDVVPIDFHTTGTWAEPIEAFVAGGLARGLPLLCTNPDLVSIQHGGRTVHMGGKIAQEYERRGGRVLYFGKPLKEHFDACITLAESTTTVSPIDRARVVHIGDSMQHDIHGARATGIDSVFIGRGIHARDVLQDAAPEAKPALDEAKLTAFVSQTGVEPTFAIAAFTW